jgi:hypothetical protein
MDTHCFKKRRYCSDNVMLTASENIKRKINDVYCDDNNYLKNTSINVIKINDTYYVNLIFCHDINQKNNFKKHKTLNY